MLELFGVALLLAGTVAVVADVAGHSGPAPAHPVTGTSAPNAVSARPSSASAAVPKALGPGNPAEVETGSRIVIPAIGVDSSIVRLGLNPDGTLEVPVSFAVAGWWSGGPYPGDPGPAVVVGHVSSSQGPGVFYRLHELHVGDTVTVTRPDGGRAVFSVTSLEEVSKRAFPTAQVYGPTAGAQLRLITCDGGFNRATGHFVDNLIVFGSLVDPAATGAAHPVQ
jgi:sortase (surface protein transpeptidase)